MIVSVFFNPFSLLYDFSPAHNMFYMTQRLYIPERILFCSYEIRLIPGGQPPQEIPPAQCPGALQGGGVNHLFRRKGAPTA